MVDTSFPSPFEIGAPPGAEGWETLYNWYHLFGEDRRAADEGKFWFQDAPHHPYVMHPYDEIQCECWWQALGAMNTRVFLVPPALGLEQRILNGRLYVSPVAAPSAEIPARSVAFGERAGHYYETWDEIYGEWKEKVLDRLRLVRMLRFDPLPDRELSRLAWVLISGRARAWYPDPRPPARAAFPRLCDRSPHGREAGSLRLAQAAAPQVGCGCRSPRAP